MPSRPRSTPTVARRRRPAAITAVAFVVIALVLAVTWFVNSAGDSGADESATAGSVSSNGSTIRTPATTTTTPRPSAAKTPPPAAAPAHVARTLALIDAGDWPEAARAPGTKGGITFRNNERRLPATDADGRRIAYREWDVNPRSPAAAGMPNGSSPGVTAPPGTPPITTARSS